MLAVKSVSMDNYLPDLLGEFAKSVVSIGQTCCFDQYRMP